MQPPTDRRDPTELAALVLSRDHARLAGRLRALDRDRAPGEDPRRAALARDVEISAAARDARAASVPALKLDESLPITAAADRIVALIREHPVIVVAGETGSGKTTQLPKLCLAAGRGAAGLIGCTQPRRIAARSVARRVAQELGTTVGELVGFQVRFTDQVGERTLIKFMTDGILLAETQGDPSLSAYDTIIVDEAHERSLNIDFLLGYLKRLVAKRPDLKVIVTSATIDTERFARHFRGAPIVDVEGRSFPVEVRWALAPFEADARPPSAREPRVNDTTADIVAAVDEIGATDPLGDVLVFLPGEREIRDAHLALSRRKYRSTEVVPLYARLSAQEQDRVFSPGPGRRIVLATNVAETSLTVPRIRYVVDPGLARINRYSQRNKVQRLQVEPISQASADQRKGRCGRIGPGICYRLYTEADFAARPRYTEPELLRSSLANVILRLLSLKLGAIEHFPFLDPPVDRAIADGYQQLLELDAITRDKQQLTDTGRTLARLPIDVKLARMLVESRKLGCLREMTVLAAFLSIQDPRERPADAREVADAAHATFGDPRSDFIVILKLWDAYRVEHEERTQSKLREWCAAHFLSFLRMREWRELHRQLLLVLAELGWLLEAARVGAEAPPTTSHGRRGDRAIGAEAPATTRRRRGPPVGGASAPTAQPTAAERQRYEAIHRALLSGLPGQIGRREMKGGYNGARGRKFQIFPGSALAKSPPQWVMSAVYLETARLYALTNARVEPEWVEQQAAHLVKRRTFDPHFDRKTGSVKAFEEVSLFGLVLTERRRIQYSRIDPAGARRVFIHDAVLTGEMEFRGDFVRLLQDALAQAREEEAKRRRQGLVRPDEELGAWLDARIPAGIDTQAGLEAWWKPLPPEQRRARIWTLEDLLVADATAREQFPATVAVLGRRLKLEYRFAPGEAGDGVTLLLPLGLLNAVPAARLTWLVPGLLVDKVAELIRALPKALRRNFIPAPDFARAFVEDVEHRDAQVEARRDRIEERESLLEALAAFLARRTGVPVPPTEWREAELPPHFRMNVRLLDEHGRPLADSRDLEGLRAEFGARARTAFAEAMASSYAREGLTRWDFDELPAVVRTDAGLAAHPALVDRGDSAAIVVYERDDAAHAAHEGGVLRLLKLALAERLRQTRKQLPLSPRVAIAYTLVDSPDALRADLVEGAFDELARGRAGELRTRDAFEQRVAELARALGPAAVARLAHVEAALTEYAALLPKLSAPLLGFAKANFDDLREQLERLVHAGFARETAGARLAELPRYLKGMSLRAERLQADPRKDQARMIEVRELEALFRAACRDDRGATHRAACERLRWLLEEYRVQLFAQDLKTKEPVSEKRLRKLIEDLRTPS
ncbi:MAG TPA: ATP-dependent RNA helicase HrpA [Candidatus Saccharimonadia bacterium]|nr:ATP-dependent RNA helicase HrpA [Candidatus Saccharimonadia bacterium]